MAFVSLTVRVPRVYKELVIDLAGESERSQGFIVQQAIYSMANGKLPPPAMKDRDEPEGERDNDASGN